MSYISDRICDCCGRALHKRGEEQDFLKLGAKGIRFGWFNEFVGYCELNEVDICKDCWKEIKAKVREHREAS